jgi:protein-tyrosine-phosphatase
VAESDSLRILVVCTANQCRSPLTAAALARHATAHDVHLEVSSAGIQAVHGLPATSPTIDAARKIGLDLSQHVSTPLDPGVVRSADVVIALERRHVQEIVLADPSSFSRTFSSSVGEPWPARNRHLSRCVNGCRSSTGVVARRTSSGPRATTT